MSSSTESKRWRKSNPTAPGTTPSSSWISLHLRLFHISSSLTLSTFIHAGNGRIQGIIAICEKGQFTNAFSARPRKKFEYGKKKTGSPVAPSLLALQMWCQRSKQCAKSPGLTRCSANLWILRNWSSNSRKFFSQTCNFNSQLYFCNFIIVIYTNVTSGPFKISIGVTQYFWRKSVKMRIPDWLKD